NATGISAGGAGLTLTGNTVFDNISTGISAGGSVIVSGNTVYGQRNGGIGVVASHGAQVSSNIVYDNTTGIAANDAASITDNQIFDNTGPGVTAGFGEITVQGNHIYGNAVGVDLGPFSGATIVNNVLEGNAQSAIHIHTTVETGGVDLRNNTIDAET